MLCSRIVFIVLALFFVGSALEVQAQLPPSVGGEPDRLVAVAATYAGQLRGAGYDVWPVDAATAQVELSVSAAEYSLLQTAGLSPEHRRWAAPLSIALNQGLEIPTGYHDLSAIEASLMATAAAFPNLAQLVDVAAVYGPGSTFEGRPIYALKISDNVSVDEDEPNVLIVGLHHCREIINPEIALDIIFQLTTGYGSDPIITDLVDNNEIWIAPVWNPDGLEYVWNTNDLWRKNRSPQVGAIGVDLNRNYDLGFNSSCSGSSNPSSSTYKGTAPESEAETQTMVAFSRSRRFAKVLDFHSSGREVLLSYTCSPLDPLIEGFNDSEGVALANIISWGTRDPSAEGEHQQWQIKETSAYSYLIETGTTFQPAHASAMTEAALTWPLVKAFLERDVPLRGNVTDASNGSPVVASLTIAGVVSQQGETRYSEAQFGRYHLFLPAGSHQVSFSAPGYAASTHTVAVGASGETVLDVSLTPTMADTGQANSAQAWLVIDGAVDANGATPGSQNGPYFATIPVGGTFTLTFEGTPNQPFLLLGGPLNRNNKIFSGIGSLDIGLLGGTGSFSDVNILLNGQNPGGFFDLLALLGPSGQQTLSFPQSGVTPGLSGALQAAVFQPGSPQVKLSAATEVTF